MRNNPNIIYCKQSEIEDMARSFPEKGLLFIYGSNIQEIMSLVDIMQSVRLDSVIVLQNNIEYAKKICQEKLVFFLYEDSGLKSSAIRGIKEVQETLFTEDDTRENHTSWVKDNLIGYINQSNYKSRRYNSEDKNRILLEWILFYKKCYLDIPVSKRDYTTWEVENPHSLLRLSSALYSKLEESIINFYFDYPIVRSKEDFERIDNTLWVSDEEIMKLDSILPEKGIVISYGFGNLSGGSYSISLLYKNNPERFVFYPSLESVLDVEKFIKEASEKLVILGVRFKNATRKKGDNGSIFQKELSAYFDNYFVKPIIITDKMAYEKAFTDNLWGSIEHSVETLSDNCYRQHMVVKKAKVNGHLSKETIAENLSYKDINAFQGEDNVIEEL